MKSHAHERGVLADGFRLGVIECAPMVRPAWLGEGLDVRVPARFGPEWDDDSEACSVATWREGGRRVALLVERHGQLFRTAAFRALLDDLLHERYLPARRPKVSFFPFNPTGWIPRGLRAALKRRLSGAGTPVGVFPSFPVDPGGELLRRLWTLALPRERSHDATATAVRNENTEHCLCVSHDVDSAEGLRLAAPMAELEKRLGVPSTYFVVGALLEQYPDRAERLRALGRDLGLHGPRHDAWLPFQPGERIRRRLETCRNLIDRFALRGYRSPLLLRTPDLLRAVGDFFAYDSSVPDVAAFTPTPRVEGCGVAAPFARCGVVEIPITMPLDSALLFLPNGERRLVDTWREKAEFLRSTGGLTHIVSHTEPHFLGREKGRRLFADFLEELLAASGARPIAVGDVVKTMGLLTL